MRPASSRTNLKCTRCNLVSYTRPSCSAVDPNIDSSPDHLASTQPLAMPRSMTWRELSFLDTVKLEPIDCALCRKGRHIMSVLTFLIRDEGREKGASDGVAFLLEHDPQTMKDS